MNPTSTSDDDDVQRQDNAAAANTNNTAGNNTLSTDVYLSPAPASAPAHPPPVSPTPLAPTPLAAPPVASAGSGARTAVDVRVSLGPSIRPALSNQRNSNNSSPIPSIKSKSSSMNAESDGDKSKHGKRKGKEQPTGSAKDQANLHRRAAALAKKVKADDASLPAVFVQHYSRIQPLLLTLVFSADGETSFFEMTRDEVLRQAKRGARSVQEEAKIQKSREDAAAAAAAGLPPVAEALPVRAPSGVGAEGSATHVPSGMKARDVRCLDKSFAASHAPLVLVRRGAVLFSLEDVRAMVVHDRCLIFVPDGADSMLSIMMNRLRHTDDGVEYSVASNRPLFEFRAYEAILTTVSNILAQDYEMLEPRVLHTLAEVLKASTGSTLERLRQSKNQVAKLLNRVQGVQHAFSTLMESDADMALMNLSRYRQDPSLFAPGLEQEQDHEDVELLLESYLQHIDGTLSQLRLLTQQTESVESMIMLRLDSARNHLLRIELMFTSLTSIAALGALVAGLFGMNLKSDVENDPDLFWIIVSIVLAGGLLAFIAFFLWTRNRGYLVT